jgi:ferredoxin-like protein FixX
MGIREMQVPAELSRLQHALDEHEKLIAVLAERLNSVLRCEPACPSDCDKASPDEMVVQVAERLRSCRRKMDQMNSVLQSVVSRIEV